MRVKKTPEYLCFLEWRREELQELVNGIAMVLTMFTYICQVQHNLTANINQISGQVNYIIESQVIAISVGKIGEAQVP